MAPRPPPLDPPLDVCPVIRQFTVSCAKQYIAIYFLAAWVKTRWVVWDVALLRRMIRLNCAEYRSLMSSAISASCRPMSPYTEL